MSLIVCNTGQNYRTQAVRYIISHHPSQSLTLDRYCVRPNSGMIPPNGEVEVQGRGNSYRTDEPTNSCSSSTGYERRAPPSTPNVAISSSYNPSSHLPIRTLTSRHSGKRSRRRPRTQSKRRKSESISCLQLAEHPMAFPPLKSSHRPTRLLLRNLTPQLLAHRSGGCLQQSRPSHRWRTRLKPLV